MLHDINGSHMHEVDLLDMTGGSQRHPDMRRIHTGINYIDASGKFVYNFAPTVLSQVSRRHNNFHDTDKVPAWI